MDEPIQAASALATQSVGAPDKRHQMRHRVAVGASSQFTGRTTTESGTA